MILGQNFKTFCYETMQIQKYNPFPIKLKTIFQVLKYFKNWKPTRNLLTCKQLKEQKLGFGIHTSGYKVNLSNVLMMDGYSVRLSFIMLFNPSRNEWDSVSVL